MGRANQLRLICSQSKTTEETTPKPAKIPQQIRLAEIPSYNSRSTLSERNIVKRQEFDFQNDRIVLKAIDPQIISGPRRGKATRIDIERKGDDLQLTIFSRKAVVMNTTWQPPTIIEEQNKIPSRYFFRLRNPETNKNSFEIATANGQTLGFKVTNFNGKSLELEIDRPRTCEVWQSNLGEKNETAGRRDILKLHQQASNAELDRAA